MRTTNDYKFATEAEADAFLKALRLFPCRGLERMTKIQQGNEWVAVVEIYIAECLRPNVY